MHIIQPQNANNGPNSEGRGGEGGGGDPVQRIHTNKESKMYSRNENTLSLSLLQVLNHITQALGLHGFVVVRLLP